VKTRVYEETGGKEEEKSVGISGRSYRGNASIWRERENEL